MQFSWSLVYGMYDMMSEDQYVLCVSKANWSVENIKILVVMWQSQLMNYCSDGLIFIIIITTD
jgi:hypothetical protein